MPVYKIYLVHDDGELETVEAFYAGCDEEALARVKAPASADARTELWQGGRFVAMALRQSRESPIGQLLRP